MENKISSVIFDFGGVLVNWNPIAFYTKVFEGDEKKAHWFIDNICTFEWHFEQDKGRKIEVAVAEKVAEFPEYEQEIRLYYDRWEECLFGAIDENVKVLEALHQQQKYQIFGLTNWSAELFPIAQRLFPFFGWFKDIVVSGAIKMVKPNPAIYKHALAQFNIAKPGNTVFIDDNINNIEAAKNLGINCIHYKDSVSLKEELAKFGVAT